MRPALFPPTEDMTVVPAKAGTHGSTDSLAERWMPAFAGMTIQSKGDRDRP
jgi:hypothetical protein